MGRHVLVVDDDPLVLEITTAMLRELGCEPVPANSGQEALEKLSSQPEIDLMITDINMPGIDGFDLAGLATMLRESLSVVLLSGGETEARGFAFIRKPFREQELAKVIKNTTGRIC